MAKKIYCAHCNCYLGEITQAKIKKNVNYLCEKCANLASIAKSKMQTNPKVKIDGFDLFNDIFK
jgi:hypothetical protein